MIPLVLVHGFMGGTAQWQGLIQRMGSDREVIELALPGYGTAADQAPLDRIGAYADWAIAALRARGVDRYHLMGHSMGGMIAQEMARRDAGAVARLILYGTGPHGTIPGRFETMEQSRQRAQIDGAEATARRISATWLLETERSADFPMVAAQAQSAGLPAILSSLTAMEHWSGIDQLDQIKARTLILWGDRDRTYDWHQTQALWSGITGAALCVLPDCAHLAHLEHPDAFASVVMQFLNTA